MLCEKCKKAEATSHFKRTINGVKEEHHLCNKCAKENGYDSFFNDFSFDFGDVLSSMLGMPYMKNQSFLSDEKKCEMCNTTLSYIMKTGNVGCANCYKTFSDSLLPSIQRIHGKTNHIGRIPKSAGSKIRIRYEIDELNKQLSAAITAQEFEKAAQLRDKINELKGRVND